MSTNALEPAGLTVLVICADRTFLRFAKATLRSGGHTAFATRTHVADAAVQVRLRAPDVVLLDVDHADADAVRRVLGRTPVVEISADPQATATRAIGKWAVPSEIVTAVEAAASAGRRRSRLHIVAS